MTQDIRGLYAVTDSHLLDGRLIEAVTAALQGGARIVQYRDKGDDSARRLADAQALRALCRVHGARLLINDDVALAIACGADGIHLGQGDLGLADARRQLGPSAIIGITCHDSLALAAAAEAGGADYLAFGAMHVSRSKPEARRCPPEILTRARARFTLPLVAIGGITPDNAGDIRRAGADAIAVIAGLWQADDIRRRAQDYLQEFHAHEQQPFRQPV